MSEEPLKALASVTRRVSFGQGEVAEALRRQIASPTQRGRLEQAWVRARDSVTSAEAGSASARETRDQVLASPWLLERTEGLFSWLAITARLVVRFDRCPEGACPLLVADLLADLAEGGFEGTVHAEIVSAFSRLETLRATNERPFWASKPPPPQGGEGRFRLGQALGQGATATVYEAWDRARGCRVALKLFHAQVGIEQHRRTREVEVLRRLHHEAIVPVLDEGTLRIDGSPRSFFAMPLVQGMPLTRASRALGSLRERLELMRRVADAVAHAHEQGIVHRDLKPENVLVDENADPHILDFGIARALSTDALIPTLGVEGTTLGTPRWMSPEQAAGDVINVDARSDVFSLGLLLFECVSASSPQDEEASAPGARVSSRRHPEVPLLRSRMPEASRDLEAIVSRCVAIDPALRYANATEVSEDLQRHLEGRPVSARRIRRPERWARTLRRHRAAVVVVASVLLVAGALFWSWQLNEASLERTRLFREEETRVQADERRAVLQAVADLEARASRGPKLEEFLSEIAGVQERLKRLRIPGDASLQRARMSMARMRGDKLLLAGKLDEGRASLEVARDLAAERARDSGGDPLLEMQVSVVMTRIGDSYGGSDPERAFREHRKVFQRDRMLRERHPGHAGLLDSYCYDLERMANHYRRRGDPLQAFRLDAERLELAFELQRLAPESPGTPRNLSLALLILHGWLCEAEFGWEDQLRIAEHARNHARERLRRAEGDALSRETYILTLQSVARDQLGCGRRVDAFQTLNETRTQLSGLSSETMRCLKLATIDVTQAGMEIEDQRLRHARQLLAQARERCETVLASPSRWYQGRACEMLLSIQILRHGLGDREEAVEALQAAKGCLDGWSGPIRRNEATFWLKWMTGRLDLRAEGEAIDPEIREILPRVLVADPSLAHDPRTHRIQVALGETPAPKPEASKPAPAAPSSPQAPKLSQTIAPILRELLKRYALDR